jgi:hypothetical protein
MRGAAHAQQGDSRRGIEAFPEQFFYPSLASTSAGLLSKASVLTRSEARVKSARGFCETELDALGTRPALSTLALLTARRRR